jgi:predicted transport protein
VLSGRGTEADRMHGFGEGADDYVVKRSFFTIEVQRQRLIVYLNLDPTKTQPWNGKSMRDVRNIGHFGMGDTEFSLRKASQLDEVKGLINQAYETTR